MFVREDRNRGTWCWLQWICLWLYLACWRQLIIGTAWRKTHMSLKSTCHRITRLTFLWYFSFLYLEIRWDILNEFRFVFVTPAKPQLDIKVVIAVESMGAASPETAWSVQWAFPPQCTQLSPQMTLCYNCMSAILIFCWQTFCSPYILHGYKRLHTQNPCSNGPGATNFAALVLCTCNLRGSPARPERAGILCLGSRSQSVLSTLFNIRSF